MNATLFVTLLAVAAPVKQPPEKIKVGDKEETREIMTIELVTEEVAVEIDGEKMQVYKADGKKVDPKDIKGLFKGQTPVLVSADGKPVDPFYLRLAKEDTLI